MLDALLYICAVCEVVGRNACRLGIGGLHGDSLFCCLALALRNLSFNLLLLLERLEKEKTMTC